MRFVAFGADVRRAVYTARINTIETLNRQIREIRKIIKTRERSFVGCTGQ